MAVSDAVREALDLNKLQLPANSPKVLRLEVESMTDMDGEPSLRVLAVIDEDTDLDNIDGRGVGEMKRIIHESLLERGIVLFPYVFIAKPSELAEHDEEDY